MSYWLALHSDLVGNLIVGALFVIAVFSTAWLKRRERKYGKYH